MGGFIRWYLHRPICLSACHASSRFSTHPCEGFLSSLHVVTRVDGSLRSTNDLTDHNCSNPLAIQTAPVSVLHQTSDTATLLLFPTRCRGLSTKINQDYFTQSDNNSPTDYHPSFILILQHNLLSSLDLQLNFLSE